MVNHEVAYSTPCGYGNKIVTDSEVIYTSQQAVNADFEAVIKMLEVATEFLSSILGLHKQDVISDLYELSGSDIMKESYDAVVRRYNPKYVPIPTITEQAVSNVVTKLKEREIANEQ